ncbi:MAG TPA: CHRD domain-containing protein [Nitrososphaeraceae archaeon]|jgi:CHRD domain|nr:CHRD domain-containing protein [Nitrososphaeraceae archaeon]
MVNKTLPILLIGLFATLLILSAGQMISSAERNYAIAQSETQRTTFNADLTGQGLPIIQTNTTASGKATLKIVGDGNTMSYDINATNLDRAENVAIGSTTGGRWTDLVVLHYGPAMGTLDNVNGTLVKGNFTSSDLVGSLQGKQMSDLLKMILDGQIYIRVQTPVQPLGEIGGQVSAAIPQ